MLHGHCQRVAEQVIAVVALVPEAVKAWEDVTTPETRSMVENPSVTVASVSHVPYPCHARLLSVTVRIQHSEAAFGAKLAGMPVIRAPVESLVQVMAGI